jgi:prolipoprotein diacylglyceryltransferase
MQCMIAIDVWLLATLCLAFLACGLIIGRWCDFHEHRK